VHRPPERVRSAVVHPTEGTSIVRIRFVLALMVAGLLCAAGVASAQQTTTEPLSDYTTSTPTTTTKTTTGQGTTTTKPATQGQSQSSVAPTVAAQPAGSAPSTLAFTGAEPLLLIIAGLALAGGTAALLVRDRRRSEDR
jgi:LPXTG-motif cell wall-anchored protein